MWAGAAFSQGATYLAYPWIHSFGAFLMVVMAIEVADSAGTAGRGAYTLGAFSSEERTNSLAYVRSALNLGLTAGALLGGAALASGNTQVVRAIPLATSAVLVINAALISTLPAASVARYAGAAPTYPSVLRNRAFLLLNVCTGY